MDADDFILLALVLIGGTAAACLIGDGCINRERQMELDTLTRHGVVCTKEDGLVLILDNERASECELLKKED